MSDKRTPRTVEVHAVEDLGSRMRRVRLRLRDPHSFPALPFTDSYVKVILTPPGVDYAWPFDPADIRSTRPPEQWPVLRTYTLRSHDPAIGDLALDVLLHEGGGAAQEWALTLEPGRTFGILGPGGKWRPQEDSGHFLLIGDASALPAIARAVEELPRGARAEVFLEVEDPDLRDALPEAPGVEVTWVDPGGALPGSRLVDVVTAAHPRTGNTSVFLHGNAEMVRDLRRTLLGEWGLDRSALSASGYWRHGCTDEQWRSQKKAFVAAMERDVA